MQLPSACRALQDVGPTRALRDPSRLQCNDKDGDKQGSPFDCFKQLTAKLVKVPKKEVDAKEAAYQRKKARKKGRSA
jgi:hypothetical protein